VISSAIWGFMSTDESVSDVSVMLGKHDDGASDSGAAGLLSL
jgi:hypothetical protein